MARPKRLVGISYVGPQAYFITTCTLNRRKVFTDHDFGAHCVRELSSTSERFAFATIAYSFMPDHVHYLVEAKDDDSPLREFVSMFKQRTGWEWKKRSQCRLWQEGYWERVLRADEAILSIARYVVENPVRACLVKSVKDYPLTGSRSYSLDEILAAYQMDLKTGWHR